MIALVVLTTGACKKSSDEPHVTGSVQLGGQPPFSPDQCAAGQHYGISGAWLFSRGPINSNEDQYRHGALVVEAARLTYIWPSDEPPPTDGLGLAARSISVDAKRDCSVFSDQGGQLTFDCSASNRRLTGTLDYKCW